MSPGQPWGRSHRRYNVDAAMVFAVSLVLSLIVWYPSLSATLAGNLDITVSGLRYLGGLAVSWVAVWTFTALVAGYGHGRPGGPPALPPGPHEHPGRRSSDGHSETLADETAA